MARGGGGGGVYSHFVFVSVVLGGFGDLFCLCICPVLLRDFHHC